MTTRPTWRTYEEVARHLLDECCAQFGLTHVEGKQLVPGLISETEWEIDAKGVDTATGQFVIIECRRYTSQGLKQEALAGLAWRILDTGAVGGITVSPLPLQEGAAKVASAAGVVEVQLNAEATTTEYFMQFLDKIRLGVSDSMTVKPTDHLVLHHYDEHGQLLRTEEIPGDNRAHDGSQAGGATKP